MNNANFDFNINQQNPWANLSMGAKVSTGIAAAAVAAAGLAASFFLAGAALFATLVFGVYGFFAKRSSDPVTVEGEAAPVDAADADVNADTAKA